MHAIFESWVAFSIVRICVGNEIKLKAIQVRVSCNEGLGRLGNCT